MAQPSNTFSTYDAIGLREELADIIYNIDPTDTPFSSAIGTRPLKTKHPEWQTQALASASDDNAVIEGDDATTDATTATARLGNHTQISDKVPLVAGSNEVHDAAGRGGEMAYQKILKGQELARDVEKALLSVNASVVGTDTLARKQGGFGAWLESNTVRGTSGADGGFKSTSGLVDAPTAGVNAAFIEANLKTSMGSAFDNGGKPSLCMLNSTLKKVFSGFTGLASDRFNIPGGERMAPIIGAADVYVSDFGNLAVVPHAYGMPAEHVYLIDPAFVAKGVYRPMFSKPLAKTGDSERAQVIEEYALIMDNEKAHGLVADATDT